MPVRIEFDNLSFHESEGKVRVVFLRYFHMYLERKDLLEIAPFKVESGAIIFDTKKKQENIENKFNFLLAEGFKGLKSSLTGKPSLYVHRNSGIPLIGSGEFGVVDRGTNMIEVKPITICNINCVFCSVDHDRRGRDLVVEREYLVEELKKVVAIKKNPIGIHIGGQGDPSLYGDLVGLVRDMSEIKKIRTISIVTNAIILTKGEVDKLMDAGLTHFHISLCAIDQEMADRIAQTKYPVKRVMDICRQIAASGKSKVILAPVWVPGLNDSEIERVIEFGKEIGAPVGVQNYLEYQFGKRPVKNPLPLKVFFERLSKLEEKHGMDLKGLCGELEIVPDAEFPKVFGKDDVIEVETVWDGRLKNTKIAIAKDKVVNLVNCQRDGRMKARIIRNKHNIYTAMPL